MRGFNIKSKKGFTLVELLVVISIIGILSSFAMVSLNSARIKARDAKRKGDMVQVRTALVLYYEDNEGYPACGTIDYTSIDSETGAIDYGATPDSDENGGGGAEGGAWCYNNALSDALTTGNRPYLSPLPVEPKNKENLETIDSTYLYRYVSDGEEYALVYRLEGDTDLHVIRGY